MLILFARAASPESSSFLNQGIEEARKGDCQAAEVDLRKALLQDPNAAAAHTAIGVCEVSSGHPERATGSFEAVARLQPQAWQAWNNLGANYLELSRSGAATKAFRKAIALNPNAGSVWFNLGSSLLQSGEKLESFRALDRAQQLSPNDAQIAQAWVKVADAVAAEAGNAIDKSQYAAAYTMLSAVHRPLERSASWNNLIGYAAFKLQKPQEAKRYLEAALRMEPDNENYLLDVGDFLASYHAYGEAAAFFEIGATRMPHSAPIRFGLAISYMLQNRTNEATALLEQLHLEYPNWDPVDRALGECYEAAGHWSSMVQLGASLQSREPGNAAGWYFEGAGRGEIAHRDGTQLSEAINALQRAVTLDPASSRYRFQLGKTFEEDKEFENAIRELKETIRLDPDDAGAHYILARAYRQMGETQLAAREFQIVRGIKTKSMQDTYIAMLTETQRSRSESLGKPQK